MPVVFVRIAGAGPGLASLINDLTDRVAYTIGETVRARNPIFLPPTGIYIDVTLEDIWYILLIRVSYVSTPTIRLTTGCRKYSTSLSTAFGILEGAGQVGGSVR